MRLTLRIYLCSLLALVVADVSKADNTLPEQAPVKAKGASVGTASVELEQGMAKTAENKIDTDRYIDISKIHTGMRGDGLTVFQGTQVERFDVEVVSVMKNYMPKRNAILIRCLDERFIKSRGVEGVSGSPVYFEGKLAGAMAFGWSFSEEPLYGVTPIDEMLAVRREPLNKSTKQNNKTNYISNGG